MSDLRELVHAQMGRAGIPSFSLEHLGTRRDRRRRRQRITAAVVALVVSAAAIGGAIRVFQNAGELVPAGTQITPENVSSLRLAWTSDIVLFDASRDPVIGDGNVYAVGGHRTLYAYGAACGSRGETCRPFWTRGGIDQVSAIGSGAVVVSSGNRWTAYPSSPQACHSGSCPNIGMGLGLPTLVKNGVLYVVPSQTRPKKNRESVSSPASYDLSCPAANQPCPARSGPDWIVSARLAWNYGEFGLGSIVGPDGSYYRGNENGGLIGYPASCAITSTTGNCYPIPVNLFPHISSTAPVVAQSDRVYVSASGNQLVAVRTSCFSSKRGAECTPVHEWRAPKSASSRPRQRGSAVWAVSGSTVLALTRERVTAYPTDCGGRDCPFTWTGPLPSPLDPSNAWNAPVIAGEMAYVATGATLSAYALDCGTAGGTCRPTWTWRDPQGNSIQELVSANGVVYARAGASVFAFSGPCGAVRCPPRWSWTSPVGTLGAMAVGEGTVVVTRWSGSRPIEHDYAIYAFRPSGG